METKFNEWVVEVKQSRLLPVLHIPWCKHIFRGPRNYIHSILNRAGGSQVCQIARSLQDWGRRG